MQSVDMRLDPSQVNVEAHERILFGKPCAQAVAEEAERYGTHRVFLLSNASLAAQDNGPLQQIAKALGPDYAGAFSGIAAHSSRDDVLAASKKARAAGADLIVAVGGGSVIDAAKSVLLCLWQQINQTEEFDAYEGMALCSLEVPNDAIRLIAVPTTFSAAEFTSISGVTNLQTGHKHLYIHRLFAPRSVILDPAVTLTAPEKLILSTGVRAIDHAVESFCSPRANLGTEAWSLQGLRLLYESLPRILTNPADMSARLQAQYGTWQAVSPIAAGVGVGASHGIGYVLGARFGVPHGITSCVMLPAVMEWNAFTNASRQHAISTALGQPEKSAAVLISDLILGLGLPRSLKDLGVDRDRFDEIAERALPYEWVRINPRPITDKKHIIEILELAW